MDTDSLVVDTALLAGSMILENGGETFRAEETAVNLCLAGGCDSASAIAFATGVLITVKKDSKTSSALKRITKRGTDLVRLDGTNSIVRNFIKGDITLETAHAELTELSEKKSTHNLLGLLASALAAMFFALLFGGNAFDAAVAFVAGFAVKAVSVSLKYTNIYNFAVSFIGGCVIAIVATFSVFLFKMGNIGSIITGATMPILPGLMLTGAIRDTVTGDLMAGTTRIVESLLVAIAIASGVGIVLSAYISMGGVL
ncbi:MAG: threonine/serine exporter family protein [Clostridia bacterium]|nr:threonine/serine exporter family protein [Clostridia bacterium]